MTLHEKALSLAKALKTKDAELVAVLLLMHRSREFVRLGYQGVFDYVQRALGLADAQAFYLRKVVATSVEVPALGAAVISGEISVSQARRIVPVVTTRNVSLWIEAAKEFPQRVLEKAVASVNPRAAKIEKIRPVYEDQSKLEMIWSDEVVDLLRRVQDLECQRTQRAVSLEEALKPLLIAHLEKHDPVKKALRAKAKPRNQFPQETSKAIPAAIKHAVVRRDQNRCQHPGCETSRWTELHHITPRAKGGRHTVENLVTLCSSHHQHAHWKH